MIEKPVWQWRSSTGDSMLNFNNATIIGRDTSIVFDSLPYAEDYTMIVIYKALDGVETNIWRMEYSDSIARSIRGLTTERIISGYTSIRYAECSALFPAINTLRQSAPDSTRPYVRLVLGDDTLQERILVAEIIYFGKRLGNSMLRRVQSASAVKYGITLGPVNYVDGNGRKIWEYAADGLYHHRVTGIGRDSTYNLYQLSSRSEMDGAMLTISTDSIAEQAFLMVGDNDAPLLFEEEDGMEVLLRQWKTQATGMDDNDFSFVFDTRNLPLPTDSLVMMMDGFFIPPTAITTNEVRFDNVWLTSDTCTFTLARGPMLWHMAQSNAGGTKGGKGRACYDDDMSFIIRNAAFSVFPNPTKGHYTIEVSGAKQVQVVIYNVHGAVVETYSDSDREHYSFSGNLPSGNSYYATVTTESGSQTMKLVVK